MKTVFKVAIVATGSLLAAAVPAMATSAMSDAFVANVHPNVDFLDASSRLAMTNSASGRVRAYAHSEAQEQTITGNSLVAWTQINTRAGQTAALGGPIVSPLDGNGGPIGDLVALPLNVVNGVTSGVSTGVDGVLSGRSVAIDGPVPAAATAPVGGGLLPSGKTDLDRLQAMKGRTFDALYRATQQDSLRQLATLYRDYIKNGDDPGLRAIAVRELPKINQRLAELRRL